ncbi:MAG: RES domain-containing protein [Acidobacteriaceae bacterium]|nr:RES domain-containing protein [Acidobacteriaceae bacterium]
MIFYRHADQRFPFLWESTDQPPARWHGPGEGPVQYLADTPDGAWAEFLRHEDITDESELVNVRRALWAVEVPDGLIAEEPRLAQTVMTGGIETYEECRTEARRLRNNAVRALRAPSAALLPGGAGGWKVDGGLQLAAERDGTVLVVFAARSDFVGWTAAFAARPRSDLLVRIRYHSSARRR